MPNTPRPAGMTAFTIVWFGQVVSLFGSAMTRFGLTLWAWQVTGQATALALVGFFSFLPELLLSPIAGALIDRWNRKLVMMISDLAAGLATVALAALVVAGRLEIWHLYLAGVIAGAGASFQWPAYSATIATLLSKEQRGRANGMMILVDCLPGILAPLAAAVLIGPLGLGGLLAIDVATFVFAVGVLLFVHIPQPPQTEAGRSAKGSLRQEAWYGVKYIMERPGLLGLQVVFLWAVAMHAFGQMLVAPMILSRTGNNSTVLGSVASATAMGEVVGGLIMSVWGGPKKKIYGVIIGWMGLNVVGHTLLGLGRSLPVWLVAAFGGALLSGLIGSSQAIWQSKVAPDVQGRVFGIRRTSELVGSPFAILLAGTLADRVFEPGMQAGGGLAPLFGWLVGTGPGAGMALLLIACGLSGGLAGLYAYLSPAIRNVERDLPDHAVATASAAADKL